MLRRSAVGEKLRITPRPVAGVGMYLEIMDLRDELGVVLDHGRELRNTGLLPTVRLRECYLLLEVASPLDLPLGLFLCAHTESHMRESC